MPTPGETEADCRFEELGVLQRSGMNPILSCNDVPYPALLTFNAGVCRYSGSYAMIFRNDLGRWGNTKLDGTNLGLATSRDGINWTVSDRPCIDIERARSLCSGWLDDPDRQVLRFYDPRLTVIEGWVYMCFAIDTIYGLRGGLARTDDFDHWEVLSLTLPDNRNLVLFPETIGGRYLRLERPMLGYMLRDRFDIWMSSSPDLHDWGGSRMVLPAERVTFSNDKIGPAAPPVRTERGWLTTFHGVWVQQGTDQRNGGWDPSWNKTYCSGVMLLDIDDPSRVIAVAEHPLLAPREPYEMGTGGLPGDNGFRNGVVFPGGFILEDDGSVKVYYGAADTVECVACGHVDDLLASLLP